MPAIPILLSDSRQEVEYKIHLAKEAVQLEDQLEALKKWRAYYEGEHSILLSDDQLAFLENVISDETDWPIDNRCQKAVNKVAGRLNVIGFEDDRGNQVELDADETGQPLLSLVSAWWGDNGFDRWEGRLYQYALRDEEGFVIIDHTGERPRFTVGQRWDGDTGIRMVYEDPETKQRPVAALKYWETADPANPEASGVLRCTLYTANAVRKYARLVNRRQRDQFIVIGDKQVDGFYPIADESDNKQWPLRWVDASGAPLGLPVIQFVSPRGSLVKPLLGLNNALNKTLIDLMAVAAQHGFGVLAIEYPEGMPNQWDNTSVTDSEDPAGDGLGYRPGRVIETSGKVRKLPADDLRGLLGLAQHWQVSIASTTDIPMYEWTPLEGNVPSGAALQILDAALSEHAIEVQEWFTSSYRKLFEMAQKLDRLYGSLRGEPELVTPMWKDPRRQSTDSELQSVQVEMAKLALEREQALGISEAVSGGSQAG